MLDYTREKNRLTHPSKECATLQIVHSPAQTEFKQIQNNDLWELECKQFVMIGQWSWSVTNRDLNHTSASTSNTHDAAVCLVE